MCPQSYLLSYVLKVRQRPNAVMMKGTMCHAALEDLYDLPAQNRTRDNLHNLLRRAWSDEKNKTRAKDLPDFFGSVEEEISWGRDALGLLDNYMALEDPSSISPAAREMWVRLNISTPCAEGGRFVARGIVDRLDDGAGGLAITDYKSGKAPDLKYSEAVNERIREEKFWQLKVYAAMMKDDVRRARL
eukprot:CAMPEP_0182460868 /NCGR_PEP_ID=MMETSP1319-20130603/5607_1 /TAXON_ID=172717 /ORGANISM="Bolidomonas pacifica, Strain RCC208" /LENGTH=187 /DNA_ID=CAMNT_0024660045 /DNA_START=443 /DNA_END=1002 /DNA_ORIENTATION=+